MDADPTFLFSSSAPPPAGFFHGYGFQGDDLVLGTEGQQRRLEVTGERVEPGEDGCYLTAFERDGALVLGSDFKGYKRLLVYDQGDVWAVSNSFPRLVDALRAQGVTLTACPAQLRAWTAEGTFFKQLTSFSTAVREIELLPSTEHLEIREGRLRRVVRPAPRAEGSYEEALRRYLERWVGRIATLLSDPELSVSVDLTGGQDSRAVLALVLACRQLFGPERLAAPHFASGTRARNAPDLAVAQALAERYGLTLNAPRPDPAPVVSAERSFAAWRDICLGTYAPIRFASHAASALAVDVGGGGGESHRRFYRLQPVARMLDEHRARFADDRTYEAFAAAVEAALERITDEGTRDLHPLVRHYREFRDRMHFGQEVQRRVKILPLAGRDLYACAAAAGTERLESNQIQYDMMQSLAPGLVLRPYDSRRKGPTAAHKANAVGPLAIDPRIGRVFRGAAASPSASPERFSRHRAMEILEERLMEARQRAPGDWLGPDCMDLALEAARAGRARGSFRYAKDGVRIHAALLAGLVSPP